MNVDHFEIRTCKNPDCGLRYPLIENHPFGERCPICLGETQVTSTHKLPIRQKDRPKKAQRTCIKSALLDNIRSTGNVGSIFRTAAGLGMKQLYLCGITPTPENKSVRKSSLKADEKLSWEYFPNAVKTAQTLKEQGHFLIALEQDENSKSIFDHEVSKLENSILIVGNEVTGVDPEIIGLCNDIIHIPMSGDTRSFNVGIAFAIAVAQLR